MQLHLRAGSEFGKEEAEPKKIKKFERAGSEERLGEKK